MKSETYLQAQTPEHKTHTLSSPTGTDLSDTDVTALGETTRAILTPPLNLLTSLQARYPQRNRPSKNGIAETATNPALAPHSTTSAQIHRIAAYCRVSLEVETTGSHTFQTQQQRIEKWANDQFGEGHYVIHWFHDDGFSGALGSGTLDSEVEDPRGIPQKRNTPSGRKVRLGLQQCRRFLQSGQADTLAIYSLSRLGRDTGLILDIIKTDIVDRRLGFRSVEEGEATNPYTPQGMLMLTALASHHTYQRQEIAARCRAAKVTAHQAGYPTGKPCFGWRMVPPHSPREGEGQQEQEKNSSSGLSYGRARPHLVQHLGEARLVRQMQQWYLQGWSLNRIVQQLNDQCIPTPTGLRYWALTTVKRILFNPLHAGLVCMDGHLLQGQHFPRRLFELEEHQELLRLYTLRSQTQSTQTGRASNHYSLTGLAFCHCGARLYVASPATHTSVALTCSQAEVHRERQWPVPRVYLGTLEAFVARHLRSLIESPPMQAALGNASASVLRQEHSLLLEHRQRLSEAVFAKHSQITRLYEHLTSDVIDGPTFEEQRNRLQAKHQQLSEQLAEAETALSHRHAQQAQGDNLSQSLLQVHTQWPHIEANERRAILELLVDTLQVRREGDQIWARLQLHLQPAVEELLVREPRPSRAWKKHPAGPPGVEGLKPRALALLYWHSQGRSFSQIASQMSITLSTVRTLISEIRHLLGEPDLDLAYALAKPRIESEFAQLPLGALRNQQSEGPLSPTLLAILRFMAEGARATDIAAEMGLSVGSVRNCQGEIYKTLQVEGAFKAVRRAKEMNLL